MDLCASFSPPVIFTTTYLLSRDITLLQHAAIRTANASKKQRLEGTKKAWTPLSPYPFSPESQRDNTILCGFLSSHSANTNIDRQQIMNTPSPSNEKVDSTNFIFKSAGGTDISANITDEATIANNPPKDDPLQPPLDSISPSGASAGADTSSPESPTKKKLTLPETPRWRFVNKAKKTEGYSSSAAGTFVKGTKIIHSRRCVK